VPSISVVVCTRTRPDALVGFPFWALPFHLRAGGREYTRVWDWLEAVSAQTAATRFREQDPAQSRFFIPARALLGSRPLDDAFGALAAALVGTAEFYLRAPRIDRVTMGALALEVLLGFLTFTASLMAFGKLQEILPTRPVTWRLQNVVNLSLLGLATGSGVYLVARPEASWLFPVFAGLSLLFGVLLIVPIGGADMPTVISLLNSYAGLSAAAMGFVLDNKLLIVAGALDGSSGFILSVIMCRAMNRSFTNVLFGAFGKVREEDRAAGKERPVRSATAEEAAGILQAAGLVIVVPGYGMAVAQAQHKVRELYDVLTKAGVEVKFAIHPVAGRMPGHMNVLLAEAGVPYDLISDLEEINAEFETADVALIIGANDVVNPVARTDKSSPIYGMPILNADKAKNVIVIKRGQGAGFSGIENALFFLDQTRMLYGDGQKAAAELIQAVKAID